MLFKKPVRAYIHIGTEKTGSTTIQKYLKINRRKLSAQGTEAVVFKGYGTSRPLVTWATEPDNPDEELNRLGLRDEAARKKWNEETRETFAQFMEQRKKCRHFVFSSEHFQSRLSRESEVRRLKDLLDEYFDEYRIIVYLRRQDEVSRSLFSTSLRTGHVRTLLPGRVNGPYYDYYGLLKRWSDVFGKENLDARRFGRKFFVGEDLLADFCDACDISGASELQRPEEKNQALSAIAQAALLEFNMHFPNSGDSRGREFHRILRKHCKEYLMDHYPGPCLLPSRSEAMEFYDNFRERNGLMYDEFFGGEQIFNDDFSKYPEESSDPLDVPGHEEALIAALESFEASHVEAEGSASGVKPKLFYQVLHKFRRIAGKVPSDE